MNEELQDGELMVRVRGGELARLGELFERHHVRLFNFFLRLTSDRTLSEDLVQEVFIRMLKYRATYREGGDFGGWMFTLARHAAVDWMRARPRELALDPELPEPPSDEPLPPVELEREEARRRLRRALARIGPDKREAVVLARWGEMKYEAIGRLLGISTGAVKLRVHRAMKELRAAYLAEQEGATP